ncbi:DMT family transporter [Novispirillum sp. DQ9]|uniref:DMT family transporter n=1 Tax=Novispirillum sp. DQ9 TaxID=3398612 RepID=UPI003C7BF7A5
MSVVPAAPTARSLYLRGILLAAAGMTIISPDGMMLHSIQTAPIWDVLFWRTFGMGVALSVVLAAIYRRRLPAMLRGQGWPGAVSAVLMSVANFLFVLAMLNTSVANTLIILATMPFWSALLGLVLIGERVGRRTWVAIAVALAGIGVILSGSVGPGFSADTLIGDLAALGAALCHGLNLVNLRRAGDRDMTAALAASGFLTAVFCVPFLHPALVSPRDWLVLGALGFVILPLALTLFLAGARTAPAAEVALLSLVETVLGPLLAWVVLGDAPGARALIGGALVLGAVGGNALVGMLRRNGA